MENNEDMSRAAVIARIKAGLKRRSGKTWSVTGGSGTAYGWISIDVPPARRTWHSVQKPGSLGVRPEDYEQANTGAPHGHTGPEDRAELAALLGLESVHQQGVSIAASHDYYREYIDRAEGRTPAKIAQQYWD